ncbi:hypothetical protein [Mesobacillus thioparans]
MGWLLIVIIAYLPIIYRIHRRLDFLEKEVERLNQNNGSRRIE